MDIIGKKYIYFAISGIVIIPGIIFLILYGLNLSIDFTQGSKITLAFPNTVSDKNISEVRTVLSQDKIKLESIEPSGKLIFVRTGVITETADSKFLTDLNSKIGNVKQEEFETIGPTIGAETLANALAALLFASLLIILYITWSFRSVPKPANSLAFGVCAIIALIHDVLVVVGVFAILGHFLKVEVDSLFVTAVLTIIGFSVHDTIVVFDRIRENLKRQGSSNFANTVNDSILQTLGRSLNTSLTVILVLLALLLFGGESIRWFVVALLIGVTSGTYSSIFNAAPLLVVWYEWSQKRRLRS